MFPALSTTTPCAAPIEALVAGPPSPELPRFPLPATVVIVWQNKGAASTASAASKLMRKNPLDIMTPTLYASRWSKCAKFVGQDAILRRVVNPPSRAYPIGSRTELLEAPARVITTALLREFSPP